MITTSKNSILTYAIIVLLLINIIVTGIVLYQKYSNHRKDSCCNEKGKHMDKNLCMSEFLDQDLKFSKAQMQHFQELKNDFHPIAKIYFDSLENLESEFFKVLENPKTDTTKLYAFANEFGRIQYGLKHKTIEHLIKIKLMCSPDQQKQYFDHIMKSRPCREGMEMRPHQKHPCPDMKK